MLLTEIHKLFYIKKKPTINLNLMTNSSYLLLIGLGWNFTKVWFTGMEMSPKSVSFIEWKRISI